jgi:hypothetical protein
MSNIRIVILVIFALVVLFLSSNMTVNKSLKARSVATSSDIEYVTINSKTGVISSEQPPPPPPPPKRLGEIFIWSASKIPDYAVACEGQKIEDKKIKVKAISDTYRICDSLLLTDEYLEKKDNVFFIPDLRGLFVRGVLPANTVGPLEQKTKVDLNKPVADSVGPHNHRVRVKKTYATTYSQFPDGNPYINANDNYSGYSDVAVPGVMENNTGTETAPKHIGMYYCMVVS